MAFASTGVAGGVGLVLTLNSVSGFLLDSRLALGSGETFGRKGRSRSRLMLMLLLLITGKGMRRGMRIGLLTILFQLVVCSVELAGLPLPFIKSIRDIGKGINLVLNEGI
jgi:hypothetical protein